MAQNTPNIQEIIPPEDVQFWPPQPGWYALGGVILIIIGIAILRFRKHKHRNAYRKEALRKLDTISNLKATDKQLQEINQLLKACALKTYPRAQVAGLAGKDWIDFLNRTSESAIFSEVRAELLSSNPYQNTIDLKYKKEDYSDLIEQCQHWIKTHKLYKH
ncbi:DUF4381 domain-containing protein [Winogradskyella sp. DF17]|uniref:DUF4381 domain-containing protein n=1 Tax=Winogradskyella pelagia TaxID=2819984 RepID=A0ABS3T3X7_9FLAO|nr:DUF4381 domain-containing protein [Winogradskyella sp. DF17]